MGSLSFLDPTTHTCTRSDNGANFWFYKLFHVEEPGERQGSGRDKTIDTTTVTMG